MKNFLQFLAAAALLAACQHDAGVASPRWTSAEKFPEFPSGGYVVRNNVWGEGPGPQSIWAISPAQWGVHADHPGTGGIKAYPHAGREVHKRLSAVPHCTSRFAVTVPAAGSYNTAYDIWCEQHAYEIMLWMNWRGKMGPIARSWDATGKPAVEVTGVTVGGHTWDVYKGTNGANVVFTFMCTSPATAGEVDIKAVLDWIKARGWFDQPAGGDVWLDEVQFGWEIASSAGGLDFAVSNFSVDLR
jgi:Glycosyl hydrolase family 12